MPLLLRKVYEEHAFMIAVYTLSIGWWSCIWVSTGSTLGDSSLQNDTLLSNLCRQGYIVHYMTIVISTSSGTSRTD